MNVAIKASQQHQQQLGFVRRYIFSTDHKVIGKQYMTLSALMAIIGGFSAYIIRWQLAWPETSIPGWGPIGPDQYNATVTMHGTVMVFFVAMPFLLGGFGNYLIPIMVGADDMAFPRLNAMSFWTQFVASLVLDRLDVRSGGAGCLGMDGIHATLRQSDLYGRLPGTGPVDSRLGA